MNPRPITPSYPPAPREVDPEHPLPVSGGGSLAATIAELRRQAAHYREQSLDLILVDSVRARKILIAAESIEERIKLLECAGKVGAKSTYRPFTYFLRARA